ncbi:hypothetical protein Aca07nite_73870 [Actinoplanes capillaceus]|uniref:Uncharacterized protein n=1 Tax=Actinoplanes campanulatus TaxID=113559 RepID=A0ABQ3WV06_9ACTN|nr:hypothetical protein Aca07nite_73870 [Actinoplanes capillaceus]
MQEAANHLLRITAVHRAGGQHPDDAVQLHPLGEPVAAEHGAHRFVADGVGEVPTDSDIVADHSDARFSGTAIQLVQGENQIPEWTRE